MKFAILIINHFVFLKNSIDKSCKNGVYFYQTIIEAATGLSDRRHTEICMRLVDGADFFKEK